MEKIILNRFKVEKGEGGFVCLYITLAKVRLYWVLGSSAGSGYCRNRPRRIVDHRPHLILDLCQMVMRGGGRYRCSTSTLSEKNYSIFVEKFLHHLCEVAWSFWCLQLLIQVIYAWLSLFVPLNQYVIFSDAKKRKLYICSITLFIRLSIHDFLFAWLIIDNVILVLISWMIL